MYRQYFGKLFSFKCNLKCNFSVPALQTNTRQLMMVTESIAVCYENQKKPTIAQCGQKSIIFIYY